MWLSHACSNVKSIQGCSTVTNPTLGPYCTIFLLRCCGLQRINRKLSSIIYNCTCVGIVGACLEISITCTSFQYHMYTMWVSHVQHFKGTNGRKKTYEIFNVYCIFYSGFMCQTIVIFGITKDESLVLNTLASWNCFTCRNLFQNGGNHMSECLTCETAFCKKAQNFV